MCGRTSQNEKFINLNHSLENHLPFQHSLVLSAETETMTTKDYQMPATSNFSVIRTRRRSIEIHSRFGVGRGTAVDCFPASRCR